MTAATEALEASGIDFVITEHGPVNSLEEAAAARGLNPGAIIKTIVVRRAEGESWSRPAAVTPVSRGRVSRYRVEVPPGLPIETLSARVPLGRLGTADEVAATALYMCSSASAFMSGHALTIDGGLVAG